ncbi:hypothetical protein LFX17_05340 [Leptospira sp. FAT1]|nr:hypothetical protein [Leptospira sanjuanensis]
MKENYNILNLPRNLREDLIGRKRIETGQGWFDLASIQEVHFSSVKIGPFADDELGQYYTNSVGLIKNSEHYGEDPEILVWLPRIGLYGTWDSSHDELHIFPDGNWNTMKSNLTPFIEAQWGYEGDDKIEHITLEDAERYPTAFDFIPYDLDKTVHNLSDGELNAFLERYEDAILRHPDVSSLDDAYFALDEMGKLKQSLDAFGKAAELCPRESMYAANLAEIHWKMGDQKQAAQYAQKAKSMGDKSPIVGEIFQSTRSSSKRSE